MEQIQERIFSKKALVVLIVPLVLEQILEVTIGLANTMMVSNVGETAISGIALVETINVLLINIFTALATGGAVVTAQYLGRKEPENAGAAAKQLLYFCAVLALFIMGVSQIWCKQILYLVFGNIEGEVMKHCVVYFRITAVSYPFLAIYNSGAALFRAEGNSKVSLYITAFMNVTNIIGNAILIYCFHLGVKGAAVSTLTTRILGAVIILLLINSPKNAICVCRIWKPEINFEMIRRIMKIGIPNGLENSVFQIGKILVQSIITSFGTAAIAADAVANGICNFEAIPGSSIGLALITVVGQCVGSGDYNGAKHYTLKLIKVTYFVLSGVCILILAFSYPLTSFFNLSEEAASLARQLIIIHSIGCVLLWPFSFTLPNSLRAANDARFTMITSMCTMWVFRIGLSYFLAYTLNLGIMGVWLAMVGDWTARATVFGIRFVRGKWKNHQLIREEAGT